MATDRNPFEPAKLVDLGTSGVWVPVDASGAALAFVVAVGSWELNAFGVLTARARVQYPVTASGLSAKIGGIPFNLSGAANARDTSAYVAYCTEVTTRYVFPTAGSNNVQIYDSAGANVTNATMSGDTIDIEITARIA